MEIDNALPYLNCDVWLEHILPRLAFEPGDLSNALCACKKFSQSSQLVWKRACLQRWPKWAAISAEPVGLTDNWKRQAELYTLREAEACTTELVKQPLRPQKVVNARHRAILTEWLCEVSCDWQIDSSVAFKAVNYLDFFLCHREITELSSFQLLGLGCLRAALDDAPMPAFDGKDKLLDPQRFADISDNTYSSEQVQECTSLIKSIIPEHLQISPNAKQFLRSFWHRITIFSRDIDLDEMHIYSSASYLLQLSLLDVECSTRCASIVSAACLSLALGMFGKPQWPDTLKCFSAYTQKDLEPIRSRLAMLQASTEASQLRHLWTLQCQDHGYPEFSAEWDKVFQLFTEPSDVLSHISPHEVSSEHLMS